MKKIRDLIVILVAIFAIGALVACGSTTPEEQVEEAAEQVDETVDEAEEAVEETAEEVEEAVEEAGAGLGMDAAMVAEQFFSEEDLEESIRWMAGQRVLRRCWHHNSLAALAVLRSASPN